MYLPRDANGGHVKTKIVRIGNSQGVRIPKPILEEAGIEGDVELRVIDSGLVILPASSARVGWRAASKELSERGEGGLIDEPTSSDFDDEWQWE